MEAYANRSKFYLGLFLLAGIILVVKLFHIQILDNSFKLTADNNSMRKVIQFPARGLIYDRHNELMVYNKVSYNVMFIPGQLKEFDSLEFCGILKIDKDYLTGNLRKAKKYSRYKPSVFLKRISAESSALLSEKLYKYPGFYITTIPVREYPDKIASHVLGYLGEIGEKEIIDDHYYKMGDYAGISGLEKEYENELRGEKGAFFFLVDVHNRVVDSYQEGRYDTIAVKGRDIITGMDIELQKYGEALLANITGSIVAIEPSTGEILTMVSSPYYNPDIFVGIERSDHFSKLLADSLNPLFNRAIMSRYSPGSIFKIVQGLIGLETKVISWETDFTCDKSLMGCHDHPYAGDLGKAIQYSCNPYFYQVYKAIIQQGIDENIFVDSRFGLEIWYDYVSSFGLGKRLNIDLSDEKPGLIPDVEFYDNWYGRSSWAFSTIYSNCNGQGEIETTPLQITNLAAIIANRGFYFRPHVVRSFKDGEEITNIVNDTINTLIEKDHFENMVEAMYNVVWGLRGTGFNARVPDVTVCGKTGTVENQQGDNHSGFFAFAPIDKPVIAISVYVENGGEGGGIAAKITSLLIEKYINGFIKQKDKEKDVLNFKIANN